MNGGIKKRNKSANEDLKWFLIKLNINKVIQREAILILLETGSAIVLVTKVFLDISHLALEDLLDILVILIKGSCLFLSWAWLSIKSLKKIRLW